VRFKVIIFWSSPYNKSIHRYVIGVSALNSTASGNSESVRRNRRGDMETILTGLEDPRGLAVDWLGYNVYWVDGSQRLIGVVSFNGLLRRNLITTEMEQPHDIVVDPLSGVMFWSDIGLSARIETARMDGSSRRILVETDVLYPTGLALDYAARRLFWADPKTASIGKLFLWHFWMQIELQTYFFICALESVNLEGKDRVVIRRFRLSIEDKPYKIDVFEDSLFLVMHQTHGISRLNKFGQGIKIIFVFQLPCPIPFMHPFELFHR